KGERLEENYPGVEFSQFTGAELLAKKYNIGRNELDKFGVLSHQRASAATRHGYFKNEIVPVEVVLADGTVDTHILDEGIRYDSSIEAMQSLVPLAEGGVITAGTASQISDGAAALMIANRHAVEKYGLQVRARFHTLTVTGSDPVIMLEGPI